MDTNNLPGNVRIKSLDDGRWEVWARSRDVEDRVLDAERGWVNIQTWSEEEAESLGYFASEEDAKRALARFGCAEHPPGRPPEGVHP